ncbi:MAG: hypothetical protein HOI41_20040 [Acidimicrobiaceae bacterium]|nr:hypothetical protein [Acidimicrobiaceae bacterium]
MSRLGDPQAELQKQFVATASLHPLSASGSMGRRIVGVDLAQHLTAHQAELLQTLLDSYHVLTFSGQDKKGLTVHHMERLANHFGAPIPHPSNFSNYGAPVDELSPRRSSDQAVTKINAAFPDAIVSVEGADTLATYPVNNLANSGPDKEPVLAGGQHWHTDIEFEPIPLSTSMFYVQCAPTTRDAPGGTWVTNPGHEPGFYHPDSSPGLDSVRSALPLNGETAFADTAAAFAALSPGRQAELEPVLVRRRLRPNDDGWLVPLVYTNPRSGTKSLHSPVWASRGKRVAPVQVQGMTDDESRTFLDPLEEHVLQPQFRYDHVHRPGDVTIWSNFSTLHVAPPNKKIINDPADARLMYRISCKGEPSYELPRPDTDAWIANNIVPPYRSPSWQS